MVNGEEWEEEEMKREDVGDEDGKSKDCEECSREDGGDNHDKLVNPLRTMTK